MEYDKIIEGILAREKENSKIPIDQVRYYLRLAMKKALDERTRMDRLLFKIGATKQQLVSLDLVDDLLHDYNEMKDKGESFSNFIKVSKCLDFPKEGVNTFDWVEVDKKHIKQIKETD